MKYTLCLSVACALLAWVPGMAATIDVKTGVSVDYDSTSTDYYIEEGGLLKFSQRQDTIFNQKFTFSSASESIPSVIGEDVAVIGWNDAENAKPRKVSFAGSTFAGQANVRVSLKSTQNSTVDLQSMSGQSFTGSVSVTNIWNGSAIVQYKGTGLAAARYIFGTAVKTYDWAVARYGWGSTNLSILSLTGDSSLAGITGSTNMTSKESITASGTNMVLTLTGSDSYTYGGAMGSASAYLNLSMTGGGTQSFTGATYLGYILLSGGSSLVLSQSATISGGITIDLTGLAAGTYNFLSGKDVELTASNLTGLGSNMRAVINGGSVTLQMVPEPTTAMLGFAGFMLLAMRRRRMR